MYRSKAGTHSVINHRGKQAFENECVNCGMPVSMHHLLVCEGIYVPAHVWRASARKMEAKQSKQDAKAAIDDPDFAEFVNKATKD